MLFGDTRRSGKERGGKRRGMIPYDDIPEHLLISHPRRPTARGCQGGRDPYQKKWQDSWIPYIRAERALGQTWVEIARGLNVGPDVLEAHMDEIEEEEPWDRD